MVGVAPRCVLRFVPELAGEGDDSASGVCESAASCTPVKTVARVATLVQPGDLVLLAGGTYDADAAFTVSGTAEKPIVFSAPREGRFRGSTSRAEATSSVLGRARHFSKQRAGRRG